MTKQGLYSAWGKYCDTNKLVDDIMELLTTYHHRNSEHGVCALLNTYFTNKEDLINLMQASGHYIGDMRIVLPQEFERENNLYDIRSFCSTFCDCIHAYDMIYKKVDKDGNRFTDYLKSGIFRLTAADFNDESTLQKLLSNKDHLSSFDSNGITCESKEIYETIVHLLRLFYKIPQSTIPGNIVREFTLYNADLKIVEGMKTSRAFNRMCEYYGLNQAENYNKIFAKYADMVSGLKRKMQFVISVNPYDYLTMSFGNSWASCHTIDKSNVRHMQNSYSGMYCGGTLSYMLDSSSIITYIVGEHDNIQKGGKIYRNMFHFQNNQMIQSRIYPQGNDGQTDLYKRFREIVQGEMADLLHLEQNLWKVRNGTNACCSVSISEGVHYKDYQCFSGANVSYPAERKDSIGDITIGHEGICPYCGEEFSSNSYISHGNCAIINE